MKTVVEISLQSNDYVLINRGKGNRVYKPTCTSRRRLERVLITCFQMMNGKYFYRRNPKLRGRNFLVKEVTGLVQEIMPDQVLAAFDTQGWLIIRLLCVDIKVGMSNEREARLWLRANGYSV